MEAHQEDYNEYLGAILRTEVDYNEYLGAILRTEVTIDQSIFQMPGEHPGSTLLVDRQRSYSIPH